LDLALPVNEKSGTIRKNNSAADFPSINLGANSDRFDQIGRLDGPAGQMFAGNIAPRQHGKYRQETEHAEESGEVHGNSLFEKTSCTGPDWNESRGGKTARDYLIIGRGLLNCKLEKALPNSQSEIYLTP